MSNNAIILGAGFSRDAEIPLLRGFVDQMCEFSVRGSWRGRELSASDRSLFDEVRRIRGKLDGYHGRAHFDDRNIEDLLSIMSFNQLASSTVGKKDFETLSLAIARTIELCCSVTYDGFDREGRARPHLAESNIYPSFWEGVFNYSKVSEEMPTIITFNYDLVLERALFQHMSGSKYNTKNQFYRDGITLDYNLQGADKFSFLTEYTPLAGPQGRIDGCTLRSAPTHSASYVHINYLKLHGSVNFEAKRRSQQIAVRSLTTPAASPFILPPVFNKTSSKNSASMWGAAMRLLRAAKNIVIVGYSLPRTDIYMQYFLKAALGPNSDLSRITVFDPVLFDSKQAGEQMRERYEECFSTQLRTRIVFQPSAEGFTGTPGSCMHFLSKLHNRPDTMFF